MAASRYAAIFASFLFATLAATAQGGRTSVVRTSFPERKTVERAVKKTGSFHSMAEVVAATKVPGRLLSLELEGGVRLEEGVKVKKGDVIARIEDGDYNAHLESAKAQVASAYADLKDAKRELDRTEALYKDGSATEQERDKARISHEKAIASLRRAVADETIAAINLKECTILSPMDGVVSRRSAEPGALLLSGAELAAINDISSLRFKASLPTAFLPRIKAGKTELYIETDSYPDSPLKAVVSRIYPLADGETRTFTIEAVVDNGGGFYAPGMYGIASIVLEKRDNALCIPYGAIVKNDDERIVYVARGDSVRAQRLVLGIRTDETVEVLEGLGDGDEIVVQGQHRLTDGAKIKRESLE